MRRLSLRASVMSGAILWTMGLFGVSGILLHIAVTHHPQVPVAFHAIFRHNHAVGLVAVICMVIGLLQVRKGISPINHLRERLSAVHQGRETHVTGAYPREVQPLVDDVNALLDDRGRRVARAIARAGDLAHGLKTPLAVISHEAEELRRAGQHEAAAAIAQQVDRMARQIDYHLAQARAVASGAAPGARASVTESAEGLVRTLQRLHASRGLRIDVATDPAHAFQGQREDLDEMLGNLLDNACRSARTRILLSSALEAGRLVVTIDDDGPGVPEEMRAVVLQRGVRSDEAGGGSGLGLAIVRDLARGYGGEIALDKAPLGGLRATLTLPSPGD